MAPEFGISAESGGAAVSHNEIPPSNKQITQAVSALVEEVRTQGPGPR